MAEGLQTLSSHIDERTMYAFKDFNRQYALHIRNHNLLSGGFLIAIGVIGATLNMRPMVVFIALLGSLLAGMLA